MRVVTGALATAALLTLLPGGAAHAAAEPDVTFSACGGQVSLFVISEKFNVKEHPFSLQFTGTVSLRLADEDSSIVVKAPGRLLVEDENGVRTFTSSGHNLFLPATPAELALNVEHFGTELPLLRGRTVLTEKIGQDGSGVAGTQQIVSAVGRVTDLCEALAQ